MPDAPTDPDLRAMIDEIARAPALHQPSEFWSELNATNYAMLSDHGLTDFKRTLAQNYFNWMVVSRRDPQFRNVFRHWLCHPRLRPWLTRMEFPELLRTTTGMESRLGASQLQIYRLFVSMLWELARDADSSGLSERLEEPALGNPIEIRRGGRRISQDLANSIREYGLVVAHDPVEPGGVRRVAELGAGYGRLGYVFLNDPATRYLIFDIPPALHVSQGYLGQLFADRRVFRFRPFDDFESIREELLASDVAFFTPNQLDLFPPGFIDVFVSISTLPEMRMDQVQHYLRVMATQTARCVYLKQWAEWFNPTDKVQYTRDTIHLDDAWELVLDRPDAVQDRFFERVWLRSHPAATANAAT